MSKRDEAHVSPTMTRMSRRGFLALVAAGGGVVVAAGGGVVALRSSAPGGTVSWRDVPVRNPAFRAMPGDLPGHTVVLCRSANREQLAYDLNASGYRVWHACADPLRPPEDPGRTAAQIARELAPGIGRDEVLSFLSRLDRSGLVSLAGVSDRAYFVYQGPG